MSPVSKPSKLLVATDRTEYCEGAIREAIDFTKQFSGSLYIISVMETNPEYETIGSNFFQKEEEEAIKYLGMLRKRVSQEGLQCQSMLLHGNNPYKNIVDAATERMVDMIVMGKRRRGRLTKVFTGHGQVTANVIGHAPCKVLVVPKCALIEYKKVLIATDGSSHSMAAAVEAVEIAKRCGSNIIAVSAARSESGLKEAKVNVDKVIEMVKNEDLPGEALTPLGRPCDVIVETAGGRAVDLIVMGTYGETGLRKLLMGSTTEKVINRADCAVLVVKVERRLRGDRLA